MVRGCLGHSNHEMIEFSIPSEVRKEINKTSALDFGGWTLGASSKLYFRKSLRKQSLITKWFSSITKKKLIICQKMSQWGRRLAWLNREVSQDLGRKRQFKTFGRRGKQFRKSTRISLGHVERKLERQKFC